MKRLLALLCLLVSAGAAQAAVKVFATLPEWGALAQEIGGDQVKVYTATHALQDPHRVDAKPSLLAQARQAQLVVATGAGLEVGWLPVVVRDSGNAAIQVGQPGYFEAAAYVQRLEVPAAVDRIHGDVHPGGNPHFQLDPRNLLKVGEALAARLADIDRANAAAYAAGYQAFAAKMRAAIPRWEKMAAPLRGVPVIVQHKSFSYLIAWLGMKEVATLEPKPGVEPTSGYLSEVLARQRAQPARMILRAAYQNEGPSAWMAREAKIPAVVLPFTVGGTPGAKDLFSLFDDTVARLLKGLE
ncbi:MAG: zinc transporter substrate-binding protein [Rhodocyclaceae bacterium]|nr:zinc transporter substrate-binding protein [Rhodocyclaceae bacterium]